MMIVVEMRKRFECSEVTLTERSSLLCQGESLNVFRSQLDYHCMSLYKIFKWECFRKRSERSCPIVHPIRKPALRRLPFPPRRTSVSPSCHRHQPKSRLPRSWISSSRFGRAIHQSSFSTTRLTDQPLCRHRSRNGLVGGVAKRRHGSKDTLLLLKKL